MTEVTVTATSRSRRRRQYLGPLGPLGPPSPIDTWPPAWRALATRWARLTTARSKWVTLLASAGGEAFETAHELLEALLSGGWIAVDEAWRAGRWQPLWIDFLALPALRQSLGLPEPGARQAAIEQARSDLLAALARWAEFSQRPEQATRRDFAQFARGDTKGITAAEWDWLAAQVDLVACGIGAHTPLLCLAAPIGLFLPRGKLDLDVAPDFIGLPPATLAQTTSANHTVRCWTLVENRTSFERVARNRAANEGAIWLPGFPPGWWQTAITRLLQLAPAPARIACDPDPAGIEIALHAGALWQVAGLDWQPWKMHPTDLASLAHKKPLTAHDYQRLAALRTTDLPPALRKLRDTLTLTGEKGEQEGYL